MAVTSDHELAIRELLERWAAAVRARDIDSIVADHTDNFVMFDVPPPFRSVGLEEYRSTWDTFFAWAGDLGVFDIGELEVVAGEDVAFVYATMRCAGYRDGQREDLDVRLTVGLIRRDGRWLVAHEHHSIPAD